MPDPRATIPLQKVSLSNEVNLHVLRLDAIGLYEGGNKFFKLKYNLQAALAQRHDRILTFGGAWSNHLAAFAACELAGVKKIAVVRGEKPATLSDTLRFCQEKNVELHFVSREDYRRKEDQAFLNSLKQKFGEFYLLPEGGSNALAVKGCREILEHVNIDFNYICCPVGSGGTLAGIASALAPTQTALGFLALKGAGYIEESVHKLATTALSNVRFIHDYHFGGFAKVNRELIGFKMQFEQANGFELDYIYTSKMFFGIKDLIRKKYFEKDSTIVAVHTGGLQGNAGFMGS